MKMKKKNKKKQPQQPKANKSALLQERSLYTYIHTYDGHTFGQKNAPSTVPLAYIAHVTTMTLYDIQH